MPGLIDANVGDFGQRVNGTPKGQGYFGVLQRPDGKVSTELSIGVNIDGKDQEIPALVPILTKPEIDHLLSGGPVTDAIAEKAANWAVQRMRAGLPVWALPGELHPLPKENP